MPQAGAELADILHVEGQVRRAGCVGGEAAESVGRRERQAKAVVGGRYVAQRDAALSLDEK